MTLPARTAPTRDERLTNLIYELLDAHRDTVDLAAGRSNGGWPCNLGGLGWRAHLDYLRALQRTARELLAEVWAAETTPTGWPERR